MASAEVFDLADYVCSVFAVVRHLEEHHRRPGEKRPQQSGKREVAKDVEEGSKTGGLSRRRDGKEAMREVPQDKRVLGFMEVRLRGPFSGCRLDWPYIRMRVMGAVIGQEAHYDVQVGSDDGLDGIDNSFDGKLGSEEDMRKFILRAKELTLEL